MLKIDQSAFMRDFFKSENMIGCNAVAISMKEGYFIKMQEINDYKKS